MRLILGIIFLVSLAGFALIFYAVFEERIPADIIPEMEENPEVSAEVSQPSAPPSQIFRADFDGPFPTEELSYFQGENRSTHVSDGGHYLVLSTAGNIGEGTIENGLLYRPVIAAENFDISLRLVPNFTEESGDRQEAGLIVYAGRESHLLLLVSKDENLKIRFENASGEGMETALPDNMRPRLRLKIEKRGEVHKAFYNPGTGWQEIGMLEVSGGSPGLIARHETDAEPFTTEFDWFAIESPTL